MDDLLIDFEALRAGQKDTHETGISKRAWLNAVRDDIKELRAGYIVMRRLLNRAGPTELDATIKSKNGRCYSQYRMMIRAAGQLKSIGILKPPKQIIAKETFPVTLRKNVSSIGKRVSSF
jgi:hypothetical protein